MTAGRVVAFDCDGVLFETLEANRQYYDHILRQFGRPRMNAGQLEFSHTHTVDQVIEHLIPDPAVQAAAHAFRRSLDYGIFLKYLTIEPDLVALLDWMEGRYPRAIATNRTDTMGRLLQEFDLTRRFEMVVTSRDVERPKPFPDPLLKILARITHPTEGSGVLRGRVGSLIEVGTGFHPELTGRENVYLNGAIMGMSRREIDRKYDEIVDFAEMAQFMDTPVKHYSSGMQVKLAFSVATSVESEILIVDEVLAVGDLNFQQKCIERMERLIKQEDRTVLIVGHNIRQIQRICNRVMLLDRGRITQDGNPADVCKIFYDEAQARNIARHRVVEGELVPERSTNSLKVRAVEILDETGDALCDDGLW